MAAGSSCGSVVCVWGGGGSLDKTVYHSQTDHVVAVSRPVTRPRCVRVCVCARAHVCGCVCGCVFRKEMGLLVQQDLVVAMFLAQLQILVVVLFALVFLLYASVCVLWRGQKTVKRKYI